MEDQNKVDLQRPPIETVINLVEICRFCLSKTKSSITINDKCSSEESKKFEEDNIYNFVTKLKLIKMEDNKNFPSKVCENCYVLIKICNEFSQLCQKSDTLLRECYDTAINETEQKLVLADNKTEIKLVKEVPDTQENENKVLNYNFEVFPSVQSPSSPIIKDKIQKLNKLRVDIFQAYKQKLNILSEKIKEARTKFKNNSKESTISIVKNSKHCCPLCYSKFSSVRALNFHNVVTHGQKRFQAMFEFKCKNCLKTFNDKKKLNKHYRVIHEISESEVSNEHMNNTITELCQGCDKLFCLYCNSHEKFQNQDELIRHLHLHKLDVAQVYSCAYCKDITFPSRAALNEHYLLIHKTNEQITGHGPIKKGLKPQNMLICVKPGNVSQQQSQNLTDVSKFLNILDSVLDSLNIVQREKESGFKLLCKNCDSSVEFLSLGDFIDHIYAHHNNSKLLDRWVIESEVKKDGNWSCTECPASYSRKQSLYDHLREKHNQTILDGTKCPEPGCSKSFSTNHQLIQHGIAIHQKYFAYFHKVFEKVFQSTDEGEDKRVKNFECDICQKKYIYKTSLKKHIFDSHLEKSVKNPVICAYCGKTLSSKFNLKSHIEFVHEALFVSCPLCKKKINFKTIGKHYKTHKTSSDMTDSRNPFLCNLCGKILKSKRSFEDHQKLHKNIRDELCDICGSGFTTKKFLRLHKKIHEGIQRKLFSCDQCEKVFSGRQTLSRHLLTHSGKKNFICEICSKCFYTLQELNRHVRYHKKEYRFDCQLCEMRFLDKSRFRLHMMRHRNVRPHKCQFCEKMFIVRGKMNSHMAAKHNVEVQNTKGVWKDPKTYVPLHDLL